MVTSPSISSDHGIDYTKNKDASRRQQNSCEKSSEERKLMWKITYAIIPWFCMIEVVQVKL